MVPGTRLAFGIRLGSPAAVGAPADGESTVSAACQPASAGDDQRFASALVTAAELPDGLAPSCPPLNQLDSIESKMGSPRLSEESSAGGGMTTAGSIRLFSWPAGVSIAAEAVVTCGVSARHCGARPDNGPGRRPVSAVTRRPGGMSGAS